MVLGEMWYLGLVIGAFVAFIVALTYVEWTWRPKVTKTLPEEAMTIERRAA